MEETKRITVEIYGTELFLDAQNRSGNSLASCGRFSVDTDLRFKIDGKEYIPQDFGDADIYRRVSVTGFVQYVGAKICMLIFQIK